MGERIRGRKGVQLRKQRLYAEPLCRDCKANGIVRAAVTPDHIKPLAKGGTDTSDNIRCLCRDCHATRTAEQFGHKAPKQSIGADGWPT
jgi:5-methylcytosine-specific restriction protein A